MNTKRIAVKNLNANERFTTTDGGTVYVCENRSYFEGGPVGVTYHLLSDPSMRAYFTLPALADVYVEV